MRLTLALLLALTTSAAAAPFLGVDSRGGTTLHGRVFTLNCKSGACGMPTIYSFCPPVERNVCTDGADPVGGLIVVSDTEIIGTTSLGGKTSGEGQGVLFELTRKSNKWTERVLKIFCTVGGHCFDGGKPYGHLELRNGAIIGTTSIGGAYGYGTVFSFDLATAGYTVLTPFFSPP